jgi:hypothetical protein
MASIRDEINNLPLPDDQTELYIEEQNITVEKLRYMLPKGSKVKVNQSTVDLVNKLIDESMCHTGLMEERLLTYMHLLGPGVGFKQLIKGIQFVTLSMTPGMTQTKAYLITFPEKADELIAEGREAGSFASQYASTKVPKAIMEGIQVGMSVTYGPLRHQLVQKLLDLSNGKAADGPASPTVQLNATLGLYDIIKIPDELTINVKQGVTDDVKEQNERLIEEVGRLADLQMQRFNKGEALRDLQKVGLTIAAEVIED